MERETEMVQLTEQGEVMAQINAWVLLVGGLGDGNCHSEELGHGLFCIGAMIAQNVEAMIDDFNDRLRMKHAREKADAGNDA